ncbi:MAG: DUF4166 domain-containing protein [Planctomycetaceae bacterium]|nr:DUF4166 domain-containing protein [Planctomycetaceae bacterium]
MPSLYERLLGHNYHGLARVLQKFHAADSHGTARGRLAVEHGSSTAARFLAWAMRLPEETEQVDVTLQISADKDRELWEQTFGERKLRTRCSAWRGLLIESMGPVVLGFELVVEDGGLRFIPKRAWLLGIPLPRWCAPRAQAQVTPAGERWKIDLKLAHPLLGQIVRYHGTMAPAPTEAVAAKR